MQMNKDVMAIGGLLLVLFVVGIITGVSFIGFQYLKETACENTYDGYTFGNETCWSSSSWDNVTGDSEADYNATYEPDITALTKIESVESVLDIVLGLLALVTVIAIFVLVVKSAKSMSSEGQY